MQRPPEYNGSKLSIVCMERWNGSCPAGEFLDNLAPAERTKLDVIFELLGDRGGISNPTKFKKLKAAGVFTIKSGQIRIFSIFTKDKRLVLLFGIRKKWRRHRGQDLDKASAMKKEFLST